ncbi:hypothetical protein SAMN02745126_04936 [Enhydrobacter aerosaccus]|uniref:Uncharacterized protein n=1 Tax=Enhydrobacter aerosaccus TaxID=225324 RepID=A0A1T4SQ59_9HYPH|nr:hypothetical protein [Enhydrobacter aerosaccus]SKA30307.1 hypothetical protein SAMN02745126_04936 [Enhydrobacter aerosaccus]
MTIQLLLAAIVVAAGAAVLAWRLAIARRRRALGQAARAIAGWIASHESAERGVPVGSYPELDALLVRERPPFGQDAGPFGPAIQGMALRVRLCIDAFRAALGQPDGTAMCGEMVLQLKLGTADLLRQLARR